MKLVQENKDAQVNGQAFVIVDPGTDSEAYWLEKGYVPPRKGPAEMEIDDLRAFYKEEVGEAPDGRWSKQRILDELKAKQEAPPKLAAPPAVASPSAAPNTK